MLSDYTTIPLTKDKVTIIDSKHAHWIKQWDWFACVSRGGYYARRTYRINNKQYVVHLSREILAKKLGRPLLKEEKADHIDGNTLNNTEKNLRIADNSQNSQNRKRHTNNTSGYPGVHRNKGRGKKWRACITAYRKRIHVGYFDTPEEAYEARTQRAKELFGEFYRDV